MSALDDLIASDAGQTPLQGSALDALIARDSGPKVATVTAQSPAATDDSLYGQLSRQVGLTARAAVNGVPGLPLMIGDALNNGLNYLPGVNLQLPSQAANQLMDKAGIPAPQNSNERIAQDVASAGFGAGGFIKAGQALSNLSNPIVRGIGNTMSSLPGMQVIGAAGSGAGSAIAREDGDGVLGQLAGGVIGGGLGVLGASGLAAGPRLLNSTISNLKGAAQPWTNPDAYVGQGLATKMGPEQASIVADRIRNAPEYVAGSLPTTAQAGGGSTLVSTEKAAANSVNGFKDLLANRSADNNNARWQALNNIAGSPDALNAAIVSRGEVTQPIYAAAHANVANIDPELANYLKIPEMQDAMKNGSSIANLDAAVGRGVAPVGFEPNATKINGAALDYTSRALGDMIGAAKQSGQSTKAGSLSILKDKVDNWMGSNIPGVADARANYADLSTPVNTMEAGQQMQGALGTRGNDVNKLPMMTLPGYRAALVKALKDQKFGIDPEAKTQLQGIGQDLQRASTSNALTSPGSDTAYNLASQGWLANQLYGSEFGGATPLGRTLGFLGATATGHPLVGLGIAGQAGKLGSMTMGRLQTPLTNFLLNPDSLLPYLDSAKQATKPLPLGFGSNVNQGLLGTFAAERASP